MSTSFCQRCQIEEVQGRRRLCGSCRDESRRESRLTWYRRNADDVNEARRIQGEPDEEDVDDNDNLWFGEGGYDQAALEQPYQHAVHFAPPEVSTGSFYRGGRRDHGHLPDPVANPEAYGITRARPPAPAPQPAAWDRFGPNVQPAAQLSSSHNIGPVPSLEAQEAAEADFAARAAQHRRDQIRASLDFSRGPRA